MKMMNHAKLISAFTADPVLVAPSAEPHVQALLATRFDAQASDQADEREYVELCAAAFGLSVDEEARKPFVFSDGIAYIPVHGALVHRFNGSYWGTTGYDYIGRLLTAAVQDDDVQGIVLDVDSYGGQVAGNFELADQVYAARSVKPILAMVDSMAYSGGYSLASAASRVVAAPSAGVGSIGVVAMHMSMEKALEKYGVTVTFVYAGKQKIDGNPYQDMPKDVKARWQKRIDKSYGQFVSLVSRNRGLSDQAVRDTEAATFDSDEALSLGLIDAIQTPSEALAAFRTELSGSNSNRSTTMSKEQQPGADTAAVETPDTTQITQAAIAGERDRISTILNSDEAKGRSALASKLALEMSMPADQAIAILSAAPVEQAPTAAAEPTSASAMFDAAMENDNPDVGAGADGQGAEGEDQATSILAAYSAATGRKFGQAKH